MNHGAQANGQKPLSNAFDLKLQFVLLLLYEHLIMTQGTSLPTQDITALNFFAWKKSRQQAV